MRCKGFSLLETIVAFMILSGFMMLIINSVVQNTQRSKKIVDMYEVTAVAENAISEVKMKLASHRTAGRYHGVSSHGYRWEANAVEIASADKPENSTNTTKGMFEIDIAVLDIDSRQRFHMQTAFFAGSGK